MQAKVADALRAFFSFSDLHPHTTIYQAVKIEFCITEAKKAKEKKDRKLVGFVSSERPATLVGKAMNAFKFNWLVDGHRKATVAQTSPSRSAASLHWQHQAWSSLGLAVFDVDLNNDLKQTDEHNQLVSLYSLESVSGQQWQVLWMQIFHEFFFSIHFFNELSYSTDVLFISFCCNDIWDWDIHKSSSGACAIPHTRSHLHAWVLACSSVGAQVRPVSPAADLHLICTLCAYGKTAEGSCQIKCRTHIVSRCCIKILLTKPLSPLRAHNAAP